MDDTPVPEPASPLPTVTSQPPKPSNNPKKLFLIGVVILLLIMGVVAAIFLWPDSSSKNSVSNKPQQYQNWLKPTSEIKIGSNRYVSPCSVLPQDVANNILGPLGGNSNIHEDFTDQTMTEGTLPQQFRCFYNHVTGNGPDIELQTEEALDSGSDTGIKTQILADADDMQAEVDRYNKAINNTKTAGQDVKNLVKDFQTSVTFYKNQPYISHDPLPANFILPISSSISGAFHNFSYSWVYKNTVYTLGHTPNANASSATSSKDVADFSDSQLVAELTKISKAYKIMQANTRNTALDQSPAPTIPGNTNTYGSTVILEPCAIMSPTVFAKITGKQQNYPVQRTSITATDLTQDKHTKDGKSLILPSNDCDRHAGDDASNTYATLDLEYGKSEAQAKTWLSKNFKQGDDDTAITTNADWAVLFKNPITSDYDPLAMFRVGPYIGRVNIYTRGGDGEVIATPEQYTAAINELAASLRQNINNIEQ